MVAFRGVIRKIVQPNVSTQSVCTSSGVCNSLFFRSPMRADFVSGDRVEWSVIGHERTDNGACDVSASDVHS